MELKQDSTVSKSEREKKDSVRNLTSKGIIGA
jgi:hypothetical protein